MKRIALALTLILALLGSAAGSVQLATVATADPLVFLPYITIKSDGTVEPETQFIEQDGNIYTLTKDLVRNYAIKIQCSNIVFDGAGHSIKGYGYSNRGLSIESVTNVTAKDIEVRGFIDADISIENTTRSVFLHVKANLHLRNSSFNTIAESTLLDYLLMRGSSNNTFMRNNFYATLGPVSSMSNMFFENNFFKKYEGLGSGIVWDNGSVGNYWFDYNGVDENGDGIGDTPYVISSEAQDRFPLMNPWDPVIPYDTVPPRISILSPENKICNESSVPLIFSIYEPASSMSYSLDGQDNITITGNSTISDLTNGVHNVTVYAKDTFGNMGASETVSFSVDVPFPTILVIVPIVSVAVIGVGVLVYFKKRKH